MRVDFCNPQKERPEDNYARYKLFSLEIVNFWLIVFSWTDLWADWFPENSGFMLVCFHCQNGINYCFRTCSPCSAWVICEGSAKGDRGKCGFICSPSVTCEKLLTVHLLKKVENCSVGSLRSLMNVLSSSWRGQIQRLFPVQKPSGRLLAAVCVPSSN